MGRTFATSDTHGNYLGFKQALERSKFDYKEDTLIHIGDICDGHIDTYKVVEELLKISNLVCIIGNHCDIFNKWIQTGVNQWDWQQGQLATAKSYLRQIDSEHLVHPKPGGGYIVGLNPDDIPPTHQKLFRSQILYYKDDKNRLFIHGGFNRHFLLKEQSDHVFYWDRDLWSQALSWESMSKGMMENKPPFKIKEDVSEIFIGHTCTLFWDVDKPMKAANIWNLDTGGGWFGRVTIMNVDTKEYFQSDLTKELYPDFKGRE